MLGRSDILYVFKYHKDNLVFIHHTLCMFVSCLYVMSRNHNGNVCFHFLVSSLYFNAHLISACTIDHFNFSIYIFF